MARRERRVVVTADLVYPRLVMLNDASGPGVIPFRGGSAVGTEREVRLALPVPSTATTSGLLGEPGAGGSRGDLVVGGFGHLEGLFPPRACLAPLAALIERPGKLEGRSVVVRIPLQQLAELRRGFLAIVPRVERVHAGLYRDVFATDLALRAEDPLEVVAPHAASPGALMISSGSITTSSTSKPSGP